jgi:hypothetical protein
MLRDALFAFYRYDHVYAVLQEFAQLPAQQRFSILEFGTSDGYSFVKLLYATRHLRLQDRVKVHTFDSFEGMPSSSDLRDRNWASGDDWALGQFRGNYRALDEYCSRHYSNYEIHRGYFEDSITSAFLASLDEYPPILIWVDCDYYTSAKTVLTRLINRIPNGAVIYFDDLDNLNYGSRLTGEARLVHEINTGSLGEHVELVPDLRLSLYSRRIYRFMKIPPNRMLFQPEAFNEPDQGAPPRRRLPLCREWLSGNGFRLTTQHRCLADEILVLLDAEIGQHPAPYLTRLVDQISSAPDAQSQWAVDVVHLDHELLDVG